MMNYYDNTITESFVHRYSVQKGSVSAKLTRLSRNQEVRTKKMEPAELDWPLSVFSVSYKG